MHGPCTLRVTNAVEQCVYIYIYFMCALLVFRGAKQIQDEEVEYREHEMCVYYMFHTFGCVCCNVLYRYAYQK